MSWLIHFIAATIFVTIGLIAMSAAYRLLNYIF